jgi:hypothetical protein
MIICDRTWARERRAVPARFKVHVSGPEVDDWFDLSQAEWTAVYEFITNPKDGKRPLLSRGNGGGLSDKGNPPENNLRA